MIGALHYWDFSLRWGDIISDYEWNYNYAWAANLAGTKPIQFQQVVL
ncbi:Putative uncharacterized protein [Moritella viscosa]|uniref:Uncharacterized protein n=1 Tax=Moritella viscosa TaxID=80854 RepID=A0A1L0BMH2_9GAMM|nr:hypothetical protein [Moritella viscosa]SGY98928.1 Putative uncharacterized protein [Moritella viscosa]SGZ05984.1 Putative uncharacterized protein [Moritella viscosa]SGZ06158.1 Putative uncharacterized protein [Moritella viscosa]SGZ13472.1 Putative uncharacterized protein [Moritella viscosa]SGZ13588.1 Putative uncharacterized protein [Moritella viscosa]